MMWGVQTYSHTGKKNHLPVEDEGGGPAFGCACLRRAFPPNFVCCDLRAAFPPLGIAAPVRFFSSLHLITGVTFSPRSCSSLSFCTFGSSSLLVPVAAKRSAAGACAEALRSARDQLCNLLSRGHDSQPHAVQNQCHGSLTMSHGHPKNKRDATVGSRSLSGMQIDNSTMKIL